MSFKKLLSALIIAGVAIGAYLYVNEAPKTPLENNEYQTLAKSREISGFLQGLVNKSSQAKIVTLGQSVGGRDIEAVLISNDPEFLEKGQANPHKLSVMLIGSQHATEESGSEALQMLVRDILTKHNSTWLNDMNLIVVVNANPDGRDLNSRFNATGGNINIDYIKLREDETTIFVNALKKYQPNIILDLHESSINKRILTNEQGYVHNYESQFGVNNNPNVDASLNHFSKDVFLPALLKNNADMGVPAQHYQGEILKLGQSVARAGLRLWNFRNYSAMNGSISILVENRLDVRSDEHPTLHNIKARTEKQLISVEAFLNTAQTYKDQILNVTDEARKNWSSSLDRDEKILMLRHDFVLNHEQPTAQIPLINVKTGQEEIHDFPNYDQVDISLPLALPQAYVITDHQQQFEKLFSRHHLTYEVIKEPKTITVTQTKIRDIITMPNRLGSSDIVVVDVDEHEAEISLKPGDLWISVDQPMGQMIPLILEVRSSDSVFQEVDYRQLLENDQVLFISRLNSLNH